MDHNKIELGLVDTQDVDLSEYHPDQIAQVIQMRKKKLEWPKLRRYRVRVLTLEQARDIQRMRVAAEVYEFENEPVLRKWQSFHLIDFLPGVYIEGVLQEPEKIYPGKFNSRNTPVICAICAATSMSHRMNSLHTKSHVRYDIRPQLIEPEQYRDYPIIPAPKHLKSNAGYFCPCCNHIVIGQKEAKKHWSACRKHFIK